MRPSTVERGGLGSWLALVLLPALLLGCAPTPEVAPTATPFAPASIGALQEALSEAAGNVRMGESLEAAPDDSTGSALWLGDERIEVYAFSDLEDRRNAQAALLSQGSPQPGGHLWGAGHLLVRYRGGEGGTVLLLSGLLGDPLTLPESPGEPYPPGVTAAIRTLAEREGVTPNQVEVVQFESAIWEDECLEAPRADERCPPGQVEGWRVQLRAAGSTYEVRTDATGQEVRIR